MFAPVSARVTTSAPVNVTVPSACSCATVSDSTLSLASILSIPVTGERADLCRRERRDVRAGIGEGDNIRPRQRHRAQRLILCDRQRQHVSAGIDFVDAVTGERADLYRRERRDVRAGIGEGDNIRPRQRHRAERLFLCNRQRQHAVVASMVSMPVPASAPI